MAMRLMASLGAGLLLLGCVAEAPERRVVSLARVNPALAQMEARRLDAEEAALHAARRDGEAPQALQSSETEARFQRLAREASESAANYSYTPPPPLLPEEAGHAERLRREAEYCRSLAADIFIETAPTSRIIASTIVGRTAYEARHYQNCMAAFSRVRIFTD